MVGISTLEAMAQAGYRLHGATQVAASIDARMGKCTLVCTNVIKMVLGLMT